MTSFTPIFPPTAATACVAARQRTTPASGSVMAIVMSSVLMTGYRLRSSAPLSTSCGTLFAFHKSSVFVMNGSAVARMMTSPV